jgi:hypothetical protein
VALGSADVTFSLTNTPSLGLGEGLFALSECRVQPAKTVLRQVPVFSLCIALGLLKELKL